MLCKKKIISLIVITMLLVGALGFSAYGASTKKVLEAWYGSIRIIIDNKDVTNTIEPFVVNGTTYIPLRVVANTFNKNVQWDQATSTAYITDDLTQVDGYYQTEILKRDVEIINLQRRLQKLEEELNDKKEMSLSDLEKKLNKDLGEYRDIDFNISLSGNTSKVTVRIDVDLYDYKSEWNALSSTRRTTYLQDIVDTILEAYKDATVVGKIRDTDARSDVLEFTTTSKGKVEIGKDSRVSISELEKYLDNEYHNYFRNIDLYIRLDGNADDVTFCVEVDYNKYKSEWNGLTDNNIKGLMSNIYDDIESELKNASIDGYVYDFYYDEDLASYYRTSTGTERFTRYKN